MLVCSAFPLFAPLPHLEHDVGDAADADADADADDHDGGDNNAAAKQTKTNLPCQGALGFSDGRSPAAFSEKELLATQLFFLSFLNCHFLHIFLVFGVFKEHKSTRELSN